MAESSTAALTVRVAAARGRSNRPGRRRSAPWHAINRDRERDRDRDRAAGGVGDGGWVTVVDQISWRAHGAGALTLQHTPTTHPTARSASALRHSSSRPCEHREAG